MSAEIATGITDDPLDSSSLIDSARRDTCGAVASFIGVVRNHDGGESVEAIEYSSHPSSSQILREIVSEFGGSSRGCIRIVAWHRVGHRRNWRGRDGCGRGCRAPRAGLRAVEALLRTSRRSYRSGRSRS